MTDWSELLFIVIFALSTRLVASADDLPCVSMMGAGGYVCVCNETYCDTVEVPKKLKRGSYYFYSTAELTPGFTKTVGKFLNTTASLEVQQTATSTNISADVYVWLDPSVERQTFQGVGAAYTDNSALVISSLPSAAQKKLVESFYGVSGLEYTFVRLPIACSDFSPSIYTYDDVPGDVNLKYFNLTDYDHTYKIPFIKTLATTSKRGVNILASTWTSPSWMKTNNDSSAPGYILEEYHKTWAEYHLKFLEAYKKEGIEIYALSMGNEVLLGFLMGGRSSFPNTILWPSEARYFTKHHLGPMLKRSGFGDIKLVFLDDDRPFMTWWSDRMYADKEVYNYISGIGLHWYFDSTSNVYKLEKYNSDYPDKFILYTESSLNSINTGGAPVNLGDWKMAVLYITNIFQNLQHWVVGYIDWNIALNPEGGPFGPSGRGLDASVIINVTNSEFYKQPIFYVLGHFSKFLQPGSKIISVTISQDDNTTDSESLNFKDQSATEEPGPSPTSTPSVPSNTVLVLAATNPDGSRSVFAYNPRSETANLIITDPDVGTFNQTVEANSINSFVFWPDATAI